MELSEYEMQRRRTMERNHLKLQELGLVGCGTMIVSGKPARGGQAQRANASSSSTSTGIGGGSPFHEVRRSPRTRGRASPMYADAADEFGHQRQGTRKRSRTSPAASPIPNERQQEEQKVLPGAIHVTRRYPSKPLTPDSSRNLECDVPRLIMDHIGRRFSAFGKAPVMDVSTASLPPKFSRMSGVTEWKNAVFLWVNVGEGGGYSNLFEGRLSSTYSDDPSAADHAEPNRVTAADPKVDATRRDTPLSSLTEDPDRNTVQDEHGTQKCAVLESRGVRSSLDPNQNAAARKQADGVVKAGGETASDVGNHEGLRMTWYAGSRMTVESALIRRLLVLNESGQHTKCTDLNADKTIDPAKVAPEEFESGAVGAVQNGSTQSEHEPGHLERRGNCYPGGSNARTTTLKVEDNSVTTAAAVKAEKETASATKPSLPALSTRSQRDVDIADSAPERDATGFPGAGGEFIHDQASDTSTGRTSAEASENKCSVESLVSSDRSSAHSCSSSGGEEDAVLLFCRLPKEPYVFCGRLAYVKHWPEERPMRFVWRLLDAKCLASHPDFHAIVEAAGIAAEAEKEKNDRDE